MPAFPAASEKRPLRTSNGSPRRPSAHDRLHRRLRQSTLARPVLSLLVRCERLRGAGRDARIRTEAVVGHGADPLPSRPALLADRAGEDLRAEAYSYSPRSDPRLTEPLREPPTATRNRSRPGVVCGAGWPCGQESRPKRGVLPTERPTRRGNALTATGSTVGPVSTGPLLFRLAALSKRGKRQGATDGFRHGTQEARPFEAPRGRRVASRPAASR